MKNMNQTINNKIFKNNIQEVKVKYELLKQNKFNANLWK